MTGSHHPAQERRTAPSWVALGLVVALLVVWFAGAAHAGHAHETGAASGCAVCLLSHGNVLADGTWGALTLFVLAGFLLMLRSEGRLSFRIRMAQPAGRGPPV